MPKSPNPDIYTVREYGNEARDTIVLLTSWKASQWMYWPVAQVLKRYGFHCVVYSYPNRTLSPNLKETKERITFIRDHIIQDVNNIKTASPGSTVNVFGTSLGALIGLLVANRADSISRVFLNVPGFDMCKSVWHWDRVVPSFKKQLLEQNINLDQIKAEWSSFRPVHNMDNMYKKELMICLAENDDVARSDIPYVEKLLSEKVNRYKLIVNRDMGHNLAGFLNLFNTKLYIDFFRKGFGSKGAHYHRISFL